MGVLSLGGKTYESSGHKKLSGVGSLPWIERQGIADHCFVVGSAIANFSGSVVPELVPSEMPILPS